MKAIHATDVLQTTYFFIQTGNFGELSEMMELEMLSMVMAAGIHDFEHPGTNNVFQNNTLSSFSLTYNDRSVLEMHHLSSSFTILKEEEYNILKGLNEDEFKKIRQSVIEMVLSTDMSVHFAELG